MDFSLAIASDPALASAYYNQGLARHRKGDVDGALGDYSQALRLKPRSEEVIYSIRVTANLYARVFEAAFRNADEDVRYNYGVNRAELERRWSFIGGHLCQCP